MTITKRKHSPEFKVEAIKLAERTTVAKAAAQLSISPSQIYDWRKTMMRNFTDVERDSYLAAENVRQAVFEYIEVDFHLTRLHSAIGYLSPTQFEQLNVA